MEGLSRQEYPAMLSNLQPSSAVTVLRDRLRRIQTVNTEIADWLQERRKAEEAYAAALNKLARKQIPSYEGLELGHFKEPWSRVVSSTLALATCHQQFGHKVEAEVERPIRDFVTSNRELNGMKTIEANLATLAKHVDTAEEKSEKMKKRGARANVTKVNEAATQVEKSLSEWESQAPFIFERLQAVDESRLNHLRDSLTQYHTLENDCAQQAMQLAEQSLSTIIDFKTEDEIKAFAMRTVNGKAKVERTRSRGTGAGGMPSSTPSIVTDDSVSVQSSGSGGAASTERSGLGHGLGLRRLGTVLKGARRHKDPYQRAGSPDKVRSSERLGTPRTHPITPVSPSREFNSVNNSPRTESRGNDRTGSTPSLVPPSTAATLDVPKQNGDGAAPSPKNSMESAQPPMTVPILPSINAVSEAPKTDSEGFSIPPSGADTIGGIPIGEEMPLEEHAPPQFKVEIRNDVIPEEEEEADAALSKVASTLRAQNTVVRKNRGRRDARDVRNTVFFPAPLQRPESPNDTSIASVAMSATPSEAGTALTSGSPPLTPLRMPRPPNFAPSETGSDTQSIRSARSITSLAGATIKHPDLHDPGLSASLIQALSISFEGGVPTKSVVIGEVAFAYNPPTTPLSSISPSPSPLPTVPLSQLLRIQNFSALEKISPNPALLTGTSQPGEYSLSTASLPPLRPTLAMRFQLHLPLHPPATLAPILLTPRWKLEPHQASLILTYRRNPLCTLSQPGSPLVLRNVIFVTGVEGAKCTNCQSKPVGTFSREKGRLAWKMPELRLDADNAEGKLIARWTTEGMVRSAPVEMRWEIDGAWAGKLASSTPATPIDGSAADEDKENAHDNGDEIARLGVEVWGAKEEKKEEKVEVADPFSDEPVVEEKEAESGEQEGWGEVRTVRKVVSGKYIAV